MKQVLHNRRKGLTALGSLAFATLASCGPVATHSGVAQPVAMPSDPATVRVANALVQADRAARSGDNAALTSPLATISALGAHPLDTAAQSTLALWQAKAPPDTAPPLRGRTLGPGYRHGTLKAGGDLQIEQTFLSGQKASIVLSSPDAAQLRLQVIDGASQAVCQHTAARPSCEWVPMFTQRHLIHVINPSRRKARFYLVVD
ncbi:hypothetical protein [Blastomonas sp.]|uniref:hypothetical protein n=1 Tax=Blastomonas sp. TaxID=1909299 RepID=UPI00260CBEC4|nr:hypothetical protein [Blastomonas sp.]MDM7955267.1 hypothetical protein [Blastomonas sp.]